MRPFKVADFSANCQSKVRMRLPVSKVNDTNLHPILPYLSALEVRSRRGAIQIHVYFYLTLHRYQVIVDYWYFFPFDSVWVPLLNVLVRGEPLNT